MARVKEDQVGIGMVSAATAVLNYRKKHPESNAEDLMGHVVSMFRDERDEFQKLASIAAAGETLSILERNPDLSDKTILSMIVAQIPEILANVESQEA